ncbi:MAG: hypothetical protein ABI758_01835 [Candidatus Woesebacteria bacterium]
MTELNLQEIENSFKQELRISIMDDPEFAGLLLESLITGYLSSESIAALRFFVWTKTMNPERRYSDWIRPAEIILNPGSITFKGEIEDHVWDGIPTNLIYLWIQEVVSEYIPPHQRYIQ